MSEKELVKKILNLKKAKNVAIFAHNYQRPEIYEVADEIGDSFNLAQKTASLKPEKLIFCGVTFMAEMAKILSPESRVFIPSVQAICPMAAMITAQKLLALKEKNPKALVLSYVNTTADTKALSDVCCTSANAAQVASRMPSDEIIFVPDKHLAAYVASKVDKKIIVSDGFCYVHSKITKEDAIEAKKNYPDAPLLVHPECPPSVIEHADQVLSTSGMINFARKSDAKIIVLATEIGMVELLKREVPRKTFLSIGGTCIQQKKITLENLLECLENETNEISIEPEIMSKAYYPLSKMLEYGRND